MSQTTCESCAYFHQHYVLGEKRIFQAYCGHCTFEKTKRKHPDKKACENYVPGQRDEAAFVSKEYLSKVLLVGVGHERNTYLHAVDERIDRPNRLAEKGFSVEITDWDGNTLRNEDFHPHATAGISIGLSEYYRNYKPALDSTGATQYGWMGNALTTCCDCRKMTDTVMRIWEHADRDVCIGIQEIPEEWYK